MPSIDSILTHPGGAHKDEFLACCVLLAFHPVPIFRREPTAEDLASRTTCVVDVGHVHQPELHNFDHHQLPREHAPTCSLSLVLQHVGLYEDARQFCDWLETAEWFDCRGPFSTAKWLGISSESLSRLVSPVDITLLRRFALASRLEPGQPLWEVMRMIGEDLLEYLHSLRSRLDFIAHHVQIWPLELAGTPSTVLFLPRTTPLPDDPSQGMDRYIEASGLSAKVVATVTPDRRSTGYGLARYRDNMRLDFTRLANQPDVHFAHARGFVAKTSATDLERLQHLLRLSAVTPA
jgi:hypothetical protein